MRYIPGYTGDIAGRERDGHCAAESVVPLSVWQIPTSRQLWEMEMFTSHRIFSRLSPVRRSTENWKEGNNFCIQLSVLAFCWHRAPPFCKNSIILHIDVVYHKM